MPSPWNTIVIGSGFGGAITACRLSEAGMKVLVLERGRRWTPETYPRDANDPWWWNQDMPQHRDGHGWIDLRVFPKIAVAQGAGVGGGSLIYANISTDAPPQAFAGGWPEAVTHAAMRPYYDRVAKFMNVQPVPTNQWPERTRVMRDGANAIGEGHRFKQLDLAVTFDPQWTYADYSRTDTSRSKPVVNAQGVMQGTCVHCGECDIGCRLKAKNTLDLNYIPWAEKHGCEVRALHQVSHVEAQGKGYRVHFVRFENGRAVAGHEDAERVIVAAGSLGSTELLLRCRDEHGTLRNLSSRLGQGWCSNGDFLTPAIHDDRMVEPTRGPTITSAIDFLDGSQGGHSFWIQDGGVPDLLAAYLRKFSSSVQTNPAAIALQGWLNIVMKGSDVSPKMMPWFAQGMDETDGRFSLRRKFWLVGRRELRLDWDVSRSAPLINEIIAMHTKLAKATGAKPMVPPSWTVAKYLVTPHPLGGCNMADSAANGVVDHRGEVFGHPRLFVVDGAIVPRALGVNPSRTIGALAERAAELIVG